MRSFLIVIGFLALSGCIDEMSAKSAVKKLLNDPGSAMFSELRKVGDTGNICGYVNAKNRMGGYVGDTPFYYESGGYAAIVSPVKDRDFQSLYRSIKAQSDFGDELIELRFKCDHALGWNRVCGSPYPFSIPDLCEVITNQSATDLYYVLRSRFDK
ncbi:MAG: hypothetical protein GX086_13705 [Alcaligenaceae bacterium]|nr:hypothetical protein [Alcaligenaceae bacterium]